MNDLKLCIFCICLFFLQATVTAQERYSSENLIINKLTDNTFVHVSYLQTESFGKVACNGLIYISDGEAAIFDTPTTDAVSAELINWVKDSLQAEIKAVIPTHFHDDCTGGLNAFHKEEIPSYGNTLTISLAQANQLTPPLNAFENQLELTIGGNKVISRFFGEGHTTDNVVVYLPKEKVLFGGCLIKGLGAGEGYTGDGNLQQWSNTVTKIKRTFTNIQYVIPGHGTPGNHELLDYTITLFEQYQTK